MKHDFEFNGQFITLDFSLDANVDFFNVRNSWRYADDIKKGIAKINTAQNVRFNDYNEFVINGVAYRCLCVEFRDVGDGLGSPYITARRVDSWQYTLTDAARREISDNLVPKLLEFALANREKARAELLEFFKKSATENIEKARESLDLAQKVIEEEAA